MDDFKFKIYEEVPADDHISYRLMEQHEDAPQSITEDQLEDFRVIEKDVTVEKLLEKKRTGSVDKVTEKNLNDAKDKFGMKHRNSDTYIGDINKLEEKRLSGKPVEAEKYIPASGYSKKLRWWETKSQDELKIASTISPIKVSQVNPMEDFQSPAPEQKPQLEQTDTINENEEDEIDPYANVDLTQFLDKVKIIDEKVTKEDSPELYILLDYDKETFGNNIELAKQVAYEVITNDRPELKSKISPNDIGESIDGSNLYLDIFGEEFVKDSQTMPEDTSDFNIQDTNTMQDINEKVDDNGTPMIMGKVTFPPGQGVDKSMIVSFVNSKNPFKITENALDDSKINEGEVTYLTSDITTASSNLDFPILVADAKDLKKKLDKDKVKNAIKNVEKHLDNKDVLKANTETHNVLSCGFFNKYELSLFMKSLTDILSKNHCSLDCLQKL